MNYKTPGVIVEEISTLPASVAGVSTAIPVFIGVTKNDLSAEGPVRITSMLEYEEKFGGADDIFTVAVQERTYYDPVKLAATPPVEDEILFERIFTPTYSGSDYMLYYHMKMYFANGGGPCYVMSSVDFTQDKITDAISASSRVDEITLICIPEANELANGFMKAVYEAAIAECALLQDRFALMDAKVGTSTTVFEDAIAFRDDGSGANDLKYGAAYYPHLETSLSPALDETIASEALPAAPSFGVVIDGVWQADAEIPTTRYSSLLTSEAQVFELEVFDTKAYADMLVAVSKNKITLAPSSSIAGIYAKVDRDRGVWKAPANVSLSKVIKPSVLVSDEEQEGLNVDATSGKSINAIRTFAGKGHLVWGARTLAGNDNEWRYVPVRRLFNYVEESVKKATEFMVFEPNTAVTWLRAKGMIENFLTGLWRDGALAGAAPSDAFFVKVGLGETMSPQDVLEGRMIIEIGMAAVRPAEFIILKFSHKLQEA